MSDQTADLGTVDLEVDGWTFAIVAYRHGGVTHVEFQGDPSGNTSDPATIAAVVKTPDGTFVRRPR